MPIRKKSNAKTPVKKSRQPRTTTKRTQNKVVNDAQLILDVVDMIIKGDNGGEIEKTIGKTKFDKIYNSAKQYIKDKVFADNVSFYANHISELQKNYNIVSGKEKLNGKNAIDLSLALKYQVQLREAQSELNLLLQFS